MGTVFGIVAVVVALVGLLVALGNVGYLAMLNNAAKKRGAAGAPISDYVKGRLPLAGGATVGGAVALLLSTGGVVPDVLALLLGAGSGLVAKQSLDTTRARFRSQP
jgi:hypothetical protein